jgi:hypothetical protein
VGVRGIDEGLIMMGDTHLTGREEVKEEKKEEQRNRTQKEHTDTGVSTTLFGGK